MSAGCKQTSHATHFNNEYQHVRINIRKSAPNELAIVTVIVRHILPLEVRSLFGASDRRRHVRIDS